MTRISAWRCSCGAYNAKADQACEACGRGQQEAPEASVTRPTLPAYREFSDRRQTFQACEHVPVGQREPCPPCEKKITDSRQQFRAYCDMIGARISPGPGATRR